MIRRGSWTETKEHQPLAIKTNGHGAKPVGVGSGPASLPIGVSGQNAAAVKNLSKFRQELMGNSGSVSGVEYPSPLLVHSASFKSNSVVKTASVGGVGSTGTSQSASFGTIRQAPEVYSPLFVMANLQLPRDRVTMNAWNRNFYTTHPLVHNCINLHATYPISKINIKCKEPKIEKFFNEMAEQIDLIGTLQSIALEYFMLGEAFPYAELDEHIGSWKSIKILNPDYMHVKKAAIGNDYSISMRPDAALLRLIQSSSPDDRRLVEQMDPEIVFHLRKGNNIPLDSFHISHLKMLAAPYDIHGTSMIVSIYKDLMLYDKIREAKFAQADNMINPITLIKVGGTTEGEYHPTPEVLESYRQIFEAAQYDKDFKIITHAGVSVERVGVGGQIIDITNDMAFIMDNILYGLMTPKSIITQEGATFNSASLGLEVLRQRYEAFRNMMEKWLIKKIFIPICEIQEFYNYDNGDKTLIVPEIDWNQMSLYDMDNYINAIKDLAAGQTPVISKTTLFRSLGLSIDEENRRLKEEAIQTAIRTKEMAILQNMSLGALRSLKSDADIIEPTESFQQALPGTVTGPSMGGALPGLSEEPGLMPGGLGGGLGGGLDLGGLGGGGGGGLAAPPAIPGGAIPPAPTPGSATPPPGPAAATAPKP